VALESEQQGAERFARVVLEQAREEWLEYLFGICMPDRRNGKQGSRCGGVARALNCRHKTGLLHFRSEQPTALSL
jgi:hypothetical protein